MNGSDASRLLDEINTHHTEFRQPIPTNQLKAPTFGQSTNGAINALMDRMTEDICSRSRALRKQLDDIEQIVLERATRTKEKLGEQVALCVRLNDEIDRTADLIADLKELANME